MLRLATNCCGVLSLRVGASIVAAIDICVGLLTLALGTAVLVVPSKYHGNGTFRFLLYNEQITLAIITMMFIAAASVFFGIVGLKAIRDHDPKGVWLFFLWKLGRLCFESMLLFTDVFRGQDMLMSFIFFVVVSSARGYLVWVVYSLHQSLIGELGPSGAFDAGYAAEEAGEHVPILQGNSQL